MKKDSRRAILAIVIVGSFCVCSLYLFLNWHYLPFIYKGYDHSFNGERIKIGQPIIEDYFIPKFKNAKRRQIWYAPDSLKHKQLHTGKFYGTEYGEITFESDSFRKRIDSNTWLKLSREYYYKIDSLSYYLEIYQDDQKISTDTLSSVKGDSILISWKKETPR